MPSPLRPEYSVHAVRALLLLCRKSHASQDLYNERSDDMPAIVLRTPFVSKRTDAWLSVCHKRDAGVHSQA
jgi:hypothetical protein